MIVLSQINGLLVEVWNIFIGHAMWYFDMNTEYVIFAARHKVHTYITLDDYCQYS